jgi:hypothetical protein
MKSKKVSLLNSIIFIIGLMIIFGAETANANNKCANTKVDYLNLVQSYADAMIEHGRDVYGPDKTPPLFAVALDRRNMKLIKKLKKTKGIRPVDRHLKCGNPMVDQNLYQILYALTVITREKRYAQEADKTLKWFFENCQSPATGLMAWGDHIGWDLEREAPGPRYKIKKGKNKGKFGLAPHELSGPWVLWERSNILAPQACATFARGLWDNQIHEHSGDFSRHANWPKPRTRSPPAQRILHRNLGRRLLSF